MNSMLFTNLGIILVSSVLVATTPLMRICTSPLLFKAVIECITSSTRIRDKPSLANKLYPFAELLHCAFDGKISCPSGFCTTLAASIVTSDSSTGFSFLSVCTVSLTSFCVKSYCNCAVFSEKGRAHKAFCPAIAIKNKAKNRFIVIE